VRDRPVGLSLAWRTGTIRTRPLETLWRYAAAVGRRLVLTTEAIRDARPEQGEAERVRAARGE
jgi:hypothetical protein